VKRFETNKISRAEALQIIREVATLRDALKEAMRLALPDCSLDKFTLRLKVKWKAAVSAEEKHRISGLFQKFASLWLFVNRHFHD
jgi:hypothetical protein